jgi:beta-N-acetylhexosaminidase
MRMLGQLWRENAERAAQVAEAIGYIIGTELQSHGIDFSFTPVLDVDFGFSSIIGDRAFSDDPLVITAIAGALVDGLRAAGASAVGKHFPGHGHVAADSHVAVPVDDREWASIERHDIVPYQGLIARGLAAIMPAHVIYPMVDSRPAGFSTVWLTKVLRAKLGFRGMIFSDDLTMEGARIAGDICSRGRQALDAGCDMVLVCNDPSACVELLNGLNYSAVDAERAERMRGRRINQPATDRYHQATGILKSMSTLS